MTVSRSLLLAISCLSAGPISAAGAPGERFDLICTGTKEGNAGTEPYSAEFRIDLRARQWCDNSCDDVRSFAKIERDRLTFSESEEGSFVEWSYVDRRTGDYIQVFRSALLRSRVHARCDRATYKPIRFKARHF